MKLNFKIVFTVLAAVVIFLVLSHYIESPTLNALKIYEAQSIQVIDEKGIERVINHNTIEEVIGFNGTIVEESKWQKSLRIGTKNIQYDLMMKLSFLDAKYIPLVRKK